MILNIFHQWRGMPFIFIMLTAILIYSTGYGSVRAILQILVPNVLMAIYVIPIITAMVRRGYPKKLSIADQDEPVTLNRGAA